MGILIKQGTSVITVVLVARINQKLCFATAIISDDNRKRVDLLENLLDYIKPEMSHDEIVAIIKNMKADYEDRVDDHIIKSAEISKARRDISRRIRELTEEDKQTSGKK